MKPTNIDCGMSPRTWNPVRDGEMAYVEDADAACRIWIDRRKDVLQLLRVRYGRRVDADLLVLIASDIEFVTCMDNAEFVDYLERNCVTPRELV